MTKVVVLIALTAASFFGWYLVLARRRREHQRVMTPSWLVEHAYEKDGDDRTR